MRRHDKKKELTVVDYSWLSDVQEVRDPLNEPHPIWVRENLKRSGPPPPQPTVPHPQRHPYCELNLGFQGHGIQFIGTEKIERRGGCAMLLGPGIPHYAILQAYPDHSMTVYFLPSLLFEMGPDNDGARILRRFTAPQSIQERIVRPPPTLWRDIKRRVVEMHAEFQRGGFGSEFRLRALLAEILTAFLRWEESMGRPVAKGVEPTDFWHVQRALAYLHEHYAEPVYVQEVAQAIGVSASRLQTMIRHALGMSCVQYLMAYRISHAKALLAEPGCRITEAALSAGFETLSHFNTTFHEHTGMSPTEFIKSLDNKN